MRFQLRHIHRLPTTCAQLQLSCPARLVPRIRPSVGRGVPGLTVPLPLAQRMVTDNRGATIGDRTRGLVLTKNVLYP